VGSVQICRCSVLISLSVTSSQGRKAPSGGRDSEVGRTVLPTFLEGRCRASLPGNGLLCPDPARRIQSSFLFLFVFFWVFLLFFSICCGFPTPGRGHKAPFLRRVCAGAVQHACGVPSWLGAWVPGVPARAWPGAGRSGRRCRVGSRRKGLMGSAATSAAGSLRRPCPPGWVPPPAGFIVLRGAPRRGRLQEGAPRRGEGAPSARTCARAGFTGKGGMGKGGAGGRGVKTSVNRVDSMGFLSGRGLGAPGDGRGGSGG
jgi:hypothetical protein